MTSKVKVSVITISYSQEKYIKQALEGFLNQKTNFIFEIIVADDGSTDATASIIKSYEEKYPALFNNILRSKNIGAIENFKDAIIRARGQYIALCEGDDYWTDPMKLQNQVDFLEKNLDYSVCFHPVRVKYEFGNHNDEIFPDRRSNFNIKKLLEKNFIQTNSVMYRAQDDYSLLADSVMPFDWYLHLYHAQYGRIGFINRVMSVYRRHENGMWSSSMNDDKSVFWSTHGMGYLYLYNELLKIYTKREHQEIIGKNIYNTFRQINESNEEYLQSVLPIITKKLPNLSRLLILSLLDSENILKNMIIEKESQINVLTRANANIENSLELIHKSRVWRTRNKIASILNKPKV